MTQSKDTVSAVLKPLEKEVKAHDVTVDDIVDVLGHSGQGTLMIIPVLAVILPIGAVPGVQPICAIMIAFISMQIILDKQSLWLPAFIKDRNIKRRPVLNMIEKMKPYLKWLDHIIYPRLTWMSSPVADRVYAVICLIWAICIVCIGFIPLLPAFIGIPILFFALGFVAKDGLMTLLGLISSMAVFVALFLTLPI